MKSVTIALVDDDKGILRAFKRLLTTKGFTVHTFDCPEVFLTQVKCLDPDAVILDVSMPGLDGLEVQTRLNRLDLPPPVVFLTGDGDIPTSVLAIKAGAANFLTKPVDEEELLNALRLAIIEGSKNRADSAEISRCKKLFDVLSVRELEVLRHVITGKLNKQIGADLGIREQTVKIHRMRITEKTGLPSVAQLVRASGNAGIEPAD